MRTWNEYKEEIAVIQSMDDEQERHERIRNNLRELNEFSLNNEPPTKEEVKELIAIRRVNLDQYVPNKESLIPVVFMRIILTNFSRKTNATMLQPEWDIFVKFWAPLLPTM